MDESKEEVLLKFMADVKSRAHKDDYKGKDSDDYEDWDWERKYRVVNQELFQNEATIYEHLFPLQGSIIPQCYALVHVPGFLREVPGILLEYIKGHTMDELKVGVNISQDDAQQADSQAFDVMHHLCDYNVIHFDLRLSNFIVSIACPLHVVIINFAILQIRNKDKTDEEWEEKVHMEDEVHGMRLILYWHWFHDRTPPPLVEDFVGYINFNGM